MSSNFFWPPLLHLLLPVFAFAFSGALHNYIQSVCYCPERVDTWAGLALARAQNIMKKLDQVSNDVTFHHHKMPEDDVTFYHRDISVLREMHEVEWRLCYRNKSRPL